MDPDFYLVRAGRRAVTMLYTNTEKVPCPGFALATPLLPGRVVFKSIPFPRLHGGTVEISADLRPGTQHGSHSLPYLSYGGKLLLHNTIGYGRVEKKD
jgi:hypothetical protein